MTPFDTELTSEATAPPGPPLTDSYGRRVTYLRVSVTDRCDLRCVYCMSEHMRFLPKVQVLSLEELDQIASAFVAMGVTKVRITGGEPLVRKGVLTLMERLSRHLASGALRELTLTTNGSRLAEFAPELARLGVGRVNVSMDTLRPDVFARLTRGGDLSRVMAGIEAAAASGIEVKINVVALAQDNSDEIPDIIAWAHVRGHAVTLIETMPMGEIEADRSDQFLSLSEVRASLESFWTLSDLPLTTGGPARYVEVAETGGQLGFITPLSHNFCESCNRVRLTCTGMLHSCLGSDDGADLRAVLRSGGDLAAAVGKAIGAKPKGHDFHIERGAAPSVARFMSTTGDDSRAPFRPAARPAGWRETVIDPAPETLSQLRHQVSRHNPQLASALAAPGVQAAVNRVLVRGDAPLEIDAEVAFMPPMSGG